MRLLSLVWLLIAIHFQLAFAPDPLPAPSSSIFPAKPATKPKRPRPTKDTDFINKFKKLKVTVTNPIPVITFEPFLYQGGSYGVLQDLCSKSGTIESDHAPHSSLLLQYLDPDTLSKLPKGTQLHTMMEKKAKLESDLRGTAFSANEENMKNLKAEMDTLDSKLGNKMTSKERGETFKKQLATTQNQIKDLERENRILKKKPAASITPDDETKLANFKNNLQSLKDKMEKIHSNARADFLKRSGLTTAEIVGSEAKLNSLKAEHANLEKVNKLLAKPLNDHVDSMKSFMAVFSLPYEAHRLFPSTGQAGLNDQIQALKNADAVEAAKVKDEYNSYFKKNMELAKKKIQPGNVEVLKDSDKFTDPQELYRHNLNEIIAGSQKYSALPDPKPTFGKEYIMDLLLKSYAKKFTTSTIHALKTPGPDGSYAHLVSLFADEYKAYLGAGVFEGDAKAGLQKWLEANKNFGVLTEADLAKLKNDFKLNDGDIPARSATDERFILQQAIEAKDAKKKMKWDEAMKKADPGSGVGAGAVCGSSGPSGRRKRSTGGSGCIFSCGKCRNNDLDNEPNKNIAGADEDAPRKNYLGDDDVLPKPKVNLPQDLDTTKVDAENLNKLLTKNLPDSDLEGVRTKNAIVDHAIKNQDKLTGTPDEIAKAKALLEMENVHAQSSQTDLATKLAHNSEGGDLIPAKSVTRFDKVKVGMKTVGKKIGKFAAKAGKKFQGAYGKIMLAKGITSAIRHGDTESLVFIGGRIGLEYGLNAYSKFGKAIAGSLGFAKSGAKLIGKIAGPIGDVLDIAWNGYMISKSVSILNDPNASKFDKNDAIADIVGNAIDIAVTSTALVLSLAFPPLAPVFAAVAFVVNLLATIAVGFYKAQNHVDRLNEEMPLLDFEKGQEYWRYVGGKDTSGYIQELIDTKKANNIAVNMTVHLLKSNPDYIGRVFPSRTLFQPEAQCYLEEKVDAKLFWFIRTHGKDWERVSECAGVGGYCEGEYEDYKCESNSESHFRVIGNHDYEYRCRCGDEPPPEWGFEVLDSKVDFRNKKSVYLERAAPDWGLESGFEYQCKPSTLSDRGKRVSRPYTSWEYLCKGAISVRRNPLTGKFMLYDLGNGRDSVYLDSYEEIDNLFIVKDGHKDFNGNAGDDTFLLDGSCRSLSGLLDGKGAKWDGGNTLVIGSDCQMDVDLTGRGRLKVENVQRVVGRDGKADKISVGCDTRQVSGGGGYSASQPDVIVLPSCGASHEVVVAVEGHTKLDATRFFEGSAFILLSKAYLHFTATVPRYVKGTLLFKFQDSVGQLTSHSISSTSISLNFGGRGSAQFNFDGEPRRALSTNQCGSNTNGDSPISIVIPKGSSTCQLLYNLEMKAVQAIHQLKTSGYSSMESVKGYDFMENIWQLESGRWQIEGGRAGNQFILKSTDFSGHLNGGYASQNSLNLINLGVNLQINFGEGTLKGDNGYQITFSYIHSLIGRQNYVENVTSSCTTKSLDIGGDLRDYVIVPELDCDNELVISVRGKADITDRKKNGTTIIQAGYDTCSSVPLDLSISTQSGVGGTNLLLSYPVHQLKKIGHGKLEIADGKVEFNLNQVYLEEGEGKSVLVYEEEQKKWISFHELSSSSLSERVRSGASIVENVFKLENGNWNVKGGEMDDSFSLVGEAFKGTLDGLGGTNKLIIGDGINQTVEVTENEILIRGDENGLLYKNIHQVIGRQEAQEVINVNCDIQQVALGGGKGINKPDKIFVRNKKCWTKLTVVGVGNTEFDSEADRGTFDLYLIPDHANNFKFKGNMMGLSSSVFFNIPIRVNSYQLREYTMTKRDELANVVINLKLKLLENDNFVHLKWTQSATNYDKRLQNTQLMFVDDESQSNGNILIDGDAEEISVLHVLQMDKSGSEKQERKGAIGAKNVFRLHNGTWDAYGGKFDDSFIINSNQFNGMVHGLGGINSLVLTEFLNETEVIEVDLPNKTLTFKGVEAIKANSIQIVGGRKGMMERVICACDTKLIMLEGGAEGRNDEIVVRKMFCEPDMTFVVEKFTSLNNNATKGNFTYHLRTDNFEINYYAELETNHAFKFEMGLEEIANVSVKRNESILLIHFVNETESKAFPLNAKNQPTFHFGPGPELVAELTLENAIPNAAIIARSPYSGKVVGFSGAENEIIISTGQIMEGVWGGDEDDIFFLNDVTSLLVINGGRGANRLQLGEELHQGLEMNVNLLKEEITFVQTGTPFATILRGVTQFVGREKSFERIVLACSTESVAEAEEIIIQNLNCNFHVKIDVGLQTRVIFTEENKMEDETEMSDEILAKDEQNEVKQEKGKSIFHYHFSTIRSFDIEFDIYPDELGLTRHIFYLNFSLSDLGSIAFNQNETRLVYSVMDSSSGLYKEYSHLLGGVDDFEMDYFQPEFMTSEGLLLRITRYGEVMGVIGNQEEILELEILQNEMIPRLAAYSLKLGIGFVIETLNDFVFCSSPAINEEAEVINNKANITSHLIGWNRTSYEILDLDKDVHIYAQGLQNNSIHIVDLSQIIGQIRKPGINYLPDVNQNGSNLEILMTNWTETFPGKVILVNGTSYYKHFLILLNSIGMELHPVESLRTKRSISDGASQLNWMLKAQPITVPEGHTFLYSASDLEDDVEIRGVEEIKDGSTSFAKMDTNLIVTNMGNDSATSLIIMDYYTPTFLTFDVADNLTEKVRNVHIRLGNVGVKLNSGKSLTDSDGKKIGVEYYEDLLERREEEILGDFPDIQRQYGLSFWWKVWRFFAEYWDWWAVLAGVISVAIFIRIIFLLFSKKKGKYEIIKARMGKVRKAIIKWRRRDSNNVKLFEIRSLSNEDEVEYNLSNAFDTQFQILASLEDEQETMLSTENQIETEEFTPVFGDVEFLSCRNVHFKGSYNSGRLSECRNCLLLSANSSLNLVENSNVNISVADSELDLIKSNHLQLSGRRIKGRLRENRNCNFIGESCEWECNSNTNLGVSGNENKLKLINNYNLQVDGDMNEICAEDNSHLRISGDGNNLFVKGTTHHSIRFGQMNSVDVKSPDYSYLPEFLNGILSSFYMKNAAELRIEYVGKGRIEGGYYSLGIFDLQIVKGLDGSFLVSIFMNLLNSFEIVENSCSEIILRGKRGNLEQSLKLKARYVEVVGEYEGKMQIKLICYLLNKFLINL